MVVEKPLVSIYTLTYKSSKTVLDTLESVYALNYQNIELIVSDDASPDNTVDVVQTWVKEHKDRFQRVEILTVDENTGVAKNQKRAIAACRGEWIKNIAGDDALYPDSIDKLMNYVQTHPEARMIQAKCARFDTYLDDEHFIEFHGSKDAPINRVTTAKQQFDILLCWACIDAPAMFYHKSVFEIPDFQTCGYKGLEDYPWFLRYTYLGNKIYFCDEVVSKYRKSSTSLQIRGNNNNLITKSYLQHFFEETHNYFHGIEKVARYVVNSYDWVNCYCKSGFLRKVHNTITYPIYWIFYRIQQQKNYKRIDNALKKG